MKTNNSNSTTVFCDGLIKNKLTIRYESFENVCTKIIWHNWLKAKEEQIKKCEIFKVVIVEKIYIVNYL